MAFLEIIAVVAILAIPAILEKWAHSEIYANSAYSAI